MGRSHTHQYTKAHCFLGRHLTCASATAKQIGHEYVANQLVGEAVALLLQQPPKPSAAILDAEEVRGRGKAACGQASSSNVWGGTSLPPFNPSQESICWPKVSVNLFLRSPVLLHTVPPILTTIWWG